MKVRMNSEIDTSGAQRPKVASGLRPSAPAPRRFFKKTPKTRDFLKQPLASRDEKTSRG